MDDTLMQIKAKVYDNCSMEINNFKLESESQDYSACKYILNGFTIISRNAKITPKKVGQFVTFWKRSRNGTIEPFNIEDKFDFFSINVQNESRIGQFVFPKSVLIDKRIISSLDTDGKRGFRVYPIWDKVQSKQAKKTQEWQLKYFYEITETLDLRQVVNLFRNL